MFKPMLAVAPDDITDVKLPVYASTKLDGIRCLFIDGKMLSRSLKPIRNGYLQQKYEPLKQYSKDYNTILDGELYGHGMTFQEISSDVMTTYKQTDQRLSYWAFDCITGEDYAQDFYSRLKELQIVIDLVMCPIVFVEQRIMQSHAEIVENFEKVQKVGYEGLILRPLYSRYKQGRSTVKEGLMLKIKPWHTWDARIVGVIQETEVDPDAPRTTNELGRSVTSKKQDDRVLIERACAFLVNYGNQMVKVSLAMTQLEREEVWENSKDYLGKMIEYKGMLVGAKNVPRHPIFVRFREDKD